MKQVIEIISQIAATSSSNEKLAILKSHKDNPTLKKVLKYTYDGSLKYGITQDIIQPYITEFYPCEVDIFSFLDKLASSNINESLRVACGKLLGSLTQDVGDLVLKILTKDLRCGISSKTINKAIPNLIPEFSCMLASKYFDNEDKVNGSFTLTIKLDGHRCLIIKNGDNIRAYTRQGKEYIGLNEIIEDVRNNISFNCVIDGELLVSNYKDITPETRYKSTSNIARKDGIKSGLTLVAFDILTLEDFSAGKSKEVYSTRRELLEKTLSNCTHLQVVDKLYQGSDKSVIVPLLDKVVSKGEEGLMLNIDSAKYECKRTKSLLKLKKFQTADVRVVDIIEGDGINKGKLGAVTIEFKHNETTHKCNCGSGFSMEEREIFFNNKSILMNNIIEITYFEVTQNSKTKEYGLRFPIFKHTRPEKSEISMH